MNSKNQVIIEHKTMSLKQREHAELYAIYSKNDRDIKLEEKSKIKTEKLEDKSLQEGHRN